MRSGTTLLADMLGCHDEISPVYETTCLVRVAKILFEGGADLPAAEKRRRVVRCMADWSRKLPFQKQTKNDYEQYVHGPHYVLFDREQAMRETEALALEIGRGDEVVAFRRFVQGLMDAHTRRDGKPSWVNKMPTYVLHLPALHRAFPEMRFIHCVRDPRDVVPSLHTRKWWQLKTFEESAAYWVRCVREAAAFEAAHPECYLEVRYEDLMAETQSSLARVFAWLGVPDTAAEILASYLDGFSFDRSRVEGWRAGMNAADIARIEGVAGPAMGRFGYRPAAEARA